MLWLREIGNNIGQIKFDLLFSLQAVKPGGRTHLHHRPVYSRLRISKAVLLQLGAM
jgi:hypothetical protein